MKKQDALKRYLKVICLCLAATFILGACSKESGTPVQFGKEESFRIARINVHDFGSVVFRLYTDEEEDICNKFIDLAKSGYYNGKPFFYIVEDYLLLAGESSEDHEEKRALGKASEKMHPFLGSLCVSYKIGTQVDLSNFYIVTLGNEQLKNIEELIETKGYTLLDYIKFGYKTELTHDELELYRQYGGAPWLDGHTAVFGQAYDGLDVLDRIVEAHTSDPDTEIVIESIETN